MSLRAHFEKELDGMREFLLSMASTVERQLELSIQALIKQDESIARQVIDGDDRLDDMMVEMEDKCVTLIATQQPLASDLRSVFSANQIAMDLERMGDYAVDIAEIAVRLKSERYIKELVDIPRMAKIAMAMVHGCIDAYVRGDVALAAKVCKMDDELDEITGGIFHEIFSMVNTDEAHIFQMIQFLFIAKYIERIGDHATNLGEWVVYNITGEHRDMNN